MPITFKAIALCPTMNLASTAPVPGFRLQMDGAKVKDARVALGPLAIDSAERSVQKTRPAGLEVKRRWFWHLKKIGPSEARTLSQ